MGLLAALGFLRQNWRLALAAGAILAGLALLAYERHQGAESVRKADAARLAQARQAIATREVKAQAITDKAASDLSAEHVRIEYRTRYLTQRIATDVPPAADAACVIPPAFRVLYNSAASASLPSGSGGSEDAAPAGGPASTRP